MPDERQAVRATLAQGVGNGDLQMIHQGRAVLVVLVGESDLFFENGSVAGLVYVSSNRERQPEGVVVEAAAHARVALLG